jgi:hypothetical protein
MAPSRFTEIIKHANVQTQPTKLKQPNSRG